MSTSYFTGPRSLHVAESLLLFLIQQEIHKLLNKNYEITCNNNKPWKTSRVGNNTHIVQIIPVSTDGM